ncbi:MAG: SDR family NAD(P)-dependent oxidoreductase, partial [Spirochaetales bacterium]
HGKLEDVGERARERGVRVSTILASLTSADDGLSLLQRVGSVDVLVVSFGPLITAPLHQTGRNDWRMLIELNFLLPSLMVSHLLPSMRANTFGRILLFGGPRSDELSGFHSIGAYAAAKSGLASLTRSVALQNAQHNITCNMIAPGYVETEYYGRDRIAELSSAMPTGRMVSRAEVARLALFLLAGDVEPVNGAIIPMDFGR